MGITNRLLEFLVICASSSQTNIFGKMDYTCTLTLGRQYCLFDNTDLSRVLCDAKLDVNNSVDDLWQLIKKTPLKNNLSADAQKYCEPLFEFLGAKTVDSIDISDYENATIIADITKEIPKQYLNKYTAVIDGGLLEHVFDYPHALKNAMCMVKDGGHLLMYTPGNNTFGHGFYQFSAELFYSVLREDNGFSNTSVFCFWKGKWYRISNPRELHKRTDYSPSGRMMLFVVSRKIGEVPEHLSAYQSDYEAIWDEYSGKQTFTGESAYRNSQKTTNMMKKIYKSVMPRQLRSWLKIGHWLEKISLPKDIFVPVKF